MNPDKFAFSSAFYFIKATKMLPEKLLTRIGRKDDFLLFDNESKDIYIVNKSVFGFLQIFSRPSALKDACKKVNIGISDDGEIVESIKDFFKEMIDRRIITVCKNQPETKPTSTVISPSDNYELLKVMRKNRKTVTAVAKDKRDEKTVVLKFLSEKPDCCHLQEITFFKREFEMMKKAGSHRLIRELLLFDEQENFAVLEYVEGKPLDELMKIGKLKVKHKLHIARQILESVSVLHQRGLAHGDIHAGQFIIAFDLSLKLIDMGISASCNDDEGMDINIKCGAVHYFEPENIIANTFDRIKDYKPCFSMDVYRAGVV
jgi:predicted Ser/Thr protein kinase